MTSDDWLAAVCDAVNRSGAIVSVMVASVDGSAPRGPGAWMLVDAEDQTGTIGGGRLEWEATRTARDMLKKPQTPWTRALRDYPLGPDMEQCCGGFVRLLYERLGRTETAILSADTPLDSLVLHPVAGGGPIVVAKSRHDAASLPHCAAGIATAMSSGQMPRRTVLTGVGEADWLVQADRPDRQLLYLYGAGHVGRAIVHALAGLPFAVAWVDTDPARFPQHLPAHASATVSANPAKIAAAAPADAWHLVMTYSHQLDFEVCAALLGRDLHGFAGLIGSDTKRARFVKRFRSAEIDDSAIARLICPIGLPGIDGKEPATIAIAVAAQLLQRLAVTDAESGRDGQRA
ncbi:MAG: xanthine dehydrogenase accessory protein XdhC [Rhodospirillaceae bacterium]|nr:xanthine dehydrogenase accessory protein XdhC [Rhodospirillaceae bacterium]